MALLYLVQAVAATVGKGIIQPEFSTIPVIFAGLIGAIIWDLITWYFGLPSSSSHALIGGLVGSALVAGGISAIVTGRSRENFDIYGNITNTWLNSEHSALQLY